MNESVSQLLVGLTSLFMIPVIGLLLILFALSVAYLGGFAAEWLTRWRRRPGLRLFISELQRASARTCGLQEIPSHYGLVSLAVQRLQDAPQAGEKILHDLHLHAERLLAQLHRGIRLGPILGLAGTLIPLGPGLLALSSGDVATLSANLAVAFTTTVIGLLVAGICFFIHSVRKQWYMQDLNDIEYLMERLETP